MPKPQVPKLRHANTVPLLDVQNNGFTYCFAHLFRMCWHSVGMPQLGHLLVRPRVFKGFHILPGIFRPQVSCGSLRTVLCGTNKFYLLHYHNISYFTISLAFYVCIYSALFMCMLSIMHQVYIYICIISIHAFLITCFIVFI